MTYKKKIRVAVIDMYNGVPNQGMEGILGILDNFRKVNRLELSLEIFELRNKNSLPDTSFDIYISSGGPGSPYDGEGEAWEASFFSLIDQLEAINRQRSHSKHLFFICHSFQLACRKYGLGEVIPRHSPAFGVFPMSLTPAGEADRLYAGLENPFYAVDSRNWQVIAADEAPFLKKGASILALEKERPHVELERCVMAIRFTPEFAGTQFHPEADAAGMKVHLLQDDRKTAVAEACGEEKYLQMLSLLDDPGKVMRTQQQILPNFLTTALYALTDGDSLQGTV